MKFSANSIVAQSLIALLFLAVVVLFTVWSFNNIYTQIGIKQNQLSHATWQRAEVFRLSELTRRLDDAGTERNQREQIAQNIREAVDTYDNRQSMFFSGDIVSSVEPIDESSLLYPILVDMDAAWHRYHESLLSFETTPQEDRPEALVKISSQAALLYSFAERLERGIQFEVERTQIQAQQLLMGLAGVLSLSAFATGIFLYRIVRGLSELGRIAHLYADGKYGIERTGQSYQEVNEVSHVLEQMADAVVAREASLKLLNETLESKVEQRTIELKQARDEAVQAQLAAQESSRLKSEFLSTMSHELRTPLNAILGYIGLLLMGVYGGLSEDVQERLHSIEDSSRHLLAMINDVLDISKIESGRLKIVSEPVIIRELEQSWVETLKVLPESAELDFKSEIDPNFPTRILGDKERLTQVVTNLVSNAVKFTEKGYVNLRIKTASSGKNWIIQVEDSGQGIAPEAQEYIFDQFRQVDGSYTRKHGGTGLGLAIVRQLCEAMNGQIQVRSKMGEGSTFIVTLPLMIPNEEEKKEVEHEY